MLRRAGGVVGELNHGEIKEALGGPYPLFDLSYASEFRAAACVCW
jgi:hypothetical protein